MAKLRPERVALLGVILMAPALVLVFGGLLQSLFGPTGFNNAIDHDLIVFHPVILLGGVFLALIINLLLVVRIQIRDGTLIGVLQVRGYLPNLTVVAATGLISGVISVYLLAENLQIFAR